MSPSPPASPTKTPQPRRVARWLVIAAVVLIAAYLIDFWRASSAEDLVPWGDDLKAAVAAAGDQDKPVLLLMTANWCPPCQDMKSDVFSEQEDAEWIANTFVPVVFRYETMSESQFQLTERLGARGFPTLMIFDTEGRMMDRRDGYAGKEPFMNWLRSFAPFDHVTTTAANPAP